MRSNTLVALPANALAGVTPPEKAKTCMPAARAASTPWMLSSTTAHSSGPNPKDYLVNLEIPAKISEDALVHPDSNGFGIHQDAVAIEDPQLEK